MTAPKLKAPKALNVFFQRGTPPCNVKFSQLSFCQFNPTLTIQTHEVDVQIFKMIKMPTKPLNLTTKQPNQNVRDVLRLGCHDPANPLFSVPASPASPISATTRILPSPIYSHLTTTTSSPPFFITLIPCKLEQKVDCPTQNQIGPYFIINSMEPSTVKQALAESHWFATIKEEYDTWALVPLPSGKKPIGCRGFSKLKKFLMDTINKYKARLAVQGFHQQHGYDLLETYTLLVKLVTVRMWHIQQLDVNDAFLNGFRKKSMSFEPEEKSLVCKLHEAHYGLKQAPRSWFGRLTTALLTFGFRSSVIPLCSPCIKVFTASLLLVSRSARTY
ncbi:hypothetical protein CR513_06580, partial [Mucuna pruriens]